MVRHVIRKNSIIALMLFVVGTTISQAASPKLIPSDSLWPGYFKNNVYVPDSVDTFRFVVTQRDCGVFAPNHGISCFALAAKCVFLFDGTLADLRTAADATKHPEIPNLPVMSDGTRNFIPPDWLNSSFPNQVLGHYTNFASGMPSSIYPGWASLFQNQDDNASNQSYGGSGNRSEIYCPNWGWPHGYYGASTKTWILYEKLYKYCVPKSWNRFAGKATLLQPIQACGATEWRGNPSTWHGVWPQISSKTGYSGDPAKGVWLPDEDYAWLWRAAVSRHPTQTQNDQGEANFGQTMSNAKCAGQPNIMITSPSRPYQPHKEGGKDYPLYAINSSIDITVKNGFTTTVPPYDLQKLEIYDGNLKLGELLPNAYNIYVLRNCLLTRPGQRPLIAIATLKDGSKATSRPAFVYVTDRFQAKDTKIVWNGSAKNTLSGIPCRSGISVKISSTSAEKAPGSSLFDIRGRMLNSRGFTNSAPRLVVTHRNSYAPDSRQ